jgi:hypothetical protein
MTTAAPSPANSIPEWVAGRRFVERLDAYRRMRKARRFGVVVKNRDLLIQVRDATTPEELEDVSW